MRDLLEREFFPYVIKPGRYAGGEPGQVVKDPAGKLKYLHAFPDKYELGQSYVGLLTLYHVVNKDDRFLCERVFAVDSDAEEIMRHKNIPLFSLESSRPAKEFDAIGFTLTYELVYTNVLAMLDLAGIPVRSKDRTDEHPIIMAGGPAVYNPEPMADFVDLFFVGDAEEGLPEMLGILYDLKGKSRQEKLEAIVRQVESVYVPAFYDDIRRPLHGFVPEKVKARLLKELKPEYYPRQPIIPLIDTVHNHLAVEIARGCPQGCRFCQAGPIYRPVRLRPQQDIIDQVDEQLSNSGYGEVCLMSLSSSDYPEIEALASTVARNLGRQKVSISLPALRPGTISSRLLEAVTLVRRAGLTIAPEAGTERLRLFIRKDFPDAAVYDSARLAFSKGWTTIKLYFMVGLPTETEEDLIGIVDIIRNVSAIGREYGGKKTVNVSLSPFVPKPHTPFQWDEMMPTDVMLHRIMFIRKRSRANHVNVKYTTIEASQLQGLLGRGGRELAGVILSAYEKGCRFDGWSEDFQFENWSEALDEHGIDIAERLKPIPFDADLPWSLVQKGVSVEHLREERQRIPIRPKDEGRKPRPDSTRQAVAGNQTGFGRGKKKLLTRDSTAPTKNRFRVRWGRTARLRYMSHLDNIRAIERSIRRSRMPVCYSKGFNPTMKLSFGPPLPLGFTSEAEFVDITLETNLVPHMVENLKEAMPEGMEIHDVRATPVRPRSLSAALNRVIYTLDMEYVPEKRALEENITEVMRADSLQVERVGKNKITSVDIRPAVYDIAISDNDTLILTLGIGDGGYARPSELLPFLVRESHCKFLLNRLHRRRMFRENAKGEEVSAMDL